MIIYDVSLDSMSGFVAQVDSVLTLSDWFESNEDRAYVIPFHIYCKYISKHERSNFDSSLFDKTYLIIERLLSNDYRMDKDGANRIISEAYEYYTRDIGFMLLKSASLYSCCDVLWRPFNIITSIPVILKEYFGYSLIDSIDSIDTQDIGFFELSLIDSFDNLINDDVLLDMLSYRKDFSLKHLIVANETSLGILVRKGLTYLKFSSKKIKGRIGGEIIEHF